MAKKSKTKTTAIHLTETQVYVLRFLVSGCERGATPSVREVCEHFGWSSPNAAYGHMRALARKGLLELRGAPAAVRIMPVAMKLYGRNQKAKASK